MNPKMALCLLVVCLVFGWFASVARSQATPPNAVPAYIVIPQPVPPISGGASVTPPPQGGPRPIYVSRGVFPWVTYVSDGTVVYRVFTPFWRRPVFVAR
jgi:hypothetical protein